MKYILMMAGTQAGVEQYLSWPQSHRVAHMRELGAIAQELHATGEFIATQALAPPNSGWLVTGGKSAMPITDGVFPETKEFLLGYWIVDVASPERATAIAARISAAPGPEGRPTNMPIEVRKFATHEGTGDKQK